MQEGCLGVGAWVGELVALGLRVLLSTGWPMPQIQLAVKEDR